MEEQETLEELARVTDRTLNILLAEDEDTDALFLIQALEGSSVSKTVHHVRDGEQALRFLRNAGEHAEAPRPQLILLDINMPKMNGYEVLQEIKADDALKSIPVIIISGSSDPEDVRKSYGHQAAAYVTKSKCLEGMNTLVSAVDSFWFQQARLPEA